MKLISHRGLINGPDLQLENTEDAITQCLLKGLEVEVDVWFNEDSSTWWLGHDFPQYKTSRDFVFQLGLWIHAKNFAAAKELNSCWKSGNVHLNYFWHENDHRTLTSLGYWWTFPQQELGPTSVAVMPERYTLLTDLHLCVTWNCYGVCSDYINKLI